MHCPECRKKNDEDALYCEFCGTRIATIADDDTTNGNTAYGHDNYIEDEEDDDLEAILSRLSLPGKNTVKEKEFISSSKANVNNANEGNNRDTSVKESELKGDSAKDNDYKDKSNIDISNKDKKEKSNKVKKNKTKNNMDIDPALPKRKNGRSVRFLRYYGFIICQIAICFILLYSFQLIGKKTFSPEEYAKKYFESLSKTDWNQVYELLDLPESKELTKSNFIRSMEGTEGIAYKSFDAAIVSESKDAATVEISYTLEDSETVKALTFDLIKTEEKKLLFFSVWKIDAANMLAVDTLLQIQEGAQVTLDEDIVQAENANAQISYLFAGNHLLEISMEGMETIKEVVYIPAGSEYQYYADELQVQNSTKEQVIQKASSYLYEIFTASMNKKEFDEIIDLFVHEDAIRQSMKEQYQEFSKAICDDEGYGLKDINFKNMTATMSQRTEGSSLILTVEIKSEYDFSKSIKKDTEETNETEAETSEDNVDESATDSKSTGSYELKSGSGNYAAVMEFVKDGDNWLLISYDFVIPEMN